MRRPAVWALLVAVGSAPAGRAQDYYPAYPYMAYQPPASPYFAYPTAAYQPPARLPELAPGQPPVAPAPRPVPRPDPKAPDAPPPNPPADRLTNPFAQPTEAGGQAARTFNENIDGDLSGVTYSRTVTTGFTTVTRQTGFTQQVTLDPRGVKIVTTTPVFTTTTVPTTTTVRVPVGTRYSGILVSENDSPAIQNRVYLGYNYYDRLNPSLNPGLGPTNLNRQMAGFEQSFFGGDASFGLRVPTVQQYGPLGTDIMGFGDMTVQSKVALVRNSQTGDIISAGLYMTAPTGAGHPLLSDGTTVPRSWLFQPWAGFVSVYDWGYLQGVTGMVVPTDRRDPTITNHTLAAGLFAYRGAENAFLRAVIPTAEVHVHAPLNHRDPNGAVYFQDQVNVTGGVHFRFARATFSPAVSVPMVGPRPFAVEGMGYLNYRY